MSVVEVVAGESIFVHKKAAGWAEQFFQPHYYAC